MRYLSLFLLLCLGCNSTPATAVRSMGTFDFQSEDKSSVDGDLTVVFDPPNHFRIVGKVWGQRVFDIGGNGEVIWQIVGDQKQVYKGSIRILTTEPFVPGEKAFLPPKISTSK